jgi:hypothetical protein
MAKQPNRVGGVLKRLDDYPDHLRAIGLVITEFSRLEGTLCFILWELIGDPDRGTAVFYSLASSKARCDIIRGAANEVLQSSGSQQEIKKEILSIITKVRDVAEQRNELAHGEWGEPSQKKENPFCILQRPATTTPVFSRHWSVTDLQSLADKISAIETRASRIALVMRALRDEEVYRHFMDQAASSEKVRAYVDRFFG